MNREETATVLAYAAAVDGRLNTPDSEQATARIVAWADALDIVGADFALDYVRRYYRHPVEWPVTPGVIREAWLVRDRRLNAPALPSGGTRAAEVPEAVRAALNAARQACRDASTLRGQP